MSNFTRTAWNPRDKVARAAHWLDNHFGSHAYGVSFDGDPHVYRPDEVEIPLDLVLVPREGEGN